MPKHTPTLLLAAFACTVLFLGTYGSSLRADVNTAHCVGKAYGTAGCPIKQLSPTCGDGRRDNGEECDNGKERNGTGNCSAECLFLACGDGIVSADLREECEPKREEVYALDPATGELTTELRFLAASCGDTCTVPTCNEDGLCSGGCRRETKPACIAEVEERRKEAERAKIAYVPRCGNGTADPGEQCDDGNLSDTDACTITCKVPRCGDGAVQVREQCDDGNTIDTDGCTNRCTLPRCGDGARQASEECDAGDGNSDVHADACRRDCRAARCGDDVIDEGEACDGGDLCTADCEQLKSAASLVIDTSSAGKIAIALSFLGGFLVLAFLFRALVHRFVRHVAGENVARSIDDIPLDEIEMPWHKW